jgi:alpha-galactosidase
LLVADLLRSTGWLCVTNDSHAGEYLAGGHEWRTNLAPDVAPLDFYAWYRSYMRQREERMRDLAAGRGDVAEVLSEDSGEDVIDIVADVYHGREASLGAVNVPNRGHIANLPDGCIVEVPGRIAHGAVVGLPVGDLPMPQSEWCRRQVEIHRLTSRAAVEGSRDLVVRALLLDPVLPNPQVADKLADALLTANRAYLPRF